MDSRINWPDGKSFAFTVFDDTDFATLENISEVYSLLVDYGFRVTKSVWPIYGNRGHEFMGDTCENKVYRKWVSNPEKCGFENGYHMATFHSSFRDETISGLEKFAQYFGHYPLSMPNHVNCRENIYWGNYRLTGVNEVIYNLMTRNRNRGMFRAHIEGDQYFWGMFAKKR